MTRKRKAALWTAGAIGTILIALYLVLPAIVLSRLNRKLAHLELYEGHVAGVSLRLLHGGLGLQEFTLILRASKAPVPLVAVEAIDLHYSWKALVHGGFVGDAVLRRPVIHYILPPKGAPRGGVQPPVAQTAKASAQKAQAQGYAYLRRVDVEDGRVEIQDDEVKPGYVLFLQDLRATAYDVGAKPGLTKKNTTVTVAGTVMDKGSLRADIAADAFAAKPTFEYAVSMKDVALPQFNDWLRKYFFIEARGGHLDFDAEAKCVDGRIHGYVKPLVVDLYAVKVKGGSNVGKQIKGEVEKLAAEVLRNPMKKQIGTQVSFSGDLDKPDVKVFPAVVELARNAFVKALSPGLRGLVDFKDFLKKG